MLGIPGDCENHPRARLRTNAVTIDETLLITILCKNPSAIQNCSALKPWRRDRTRSAQHPHPRLPPRIGTHAYKTIPKVDIGPLCGQAISNRWPSQRGRPDGRPKKDRATGWTSGRDSILLDVHHRPRRTGAAGDKFGYARGHFARLTRGLEAPVSLRRKTHARSLCRIPETDSVFIGSGAATALRNPPLGR